ncbi:MAG: GNAT family N-acetyltransferase [Mycobacteriales bacterium]
MHEIIRTDRLLLRRFEPSDVDNLLDLYGDPHVMRYIDTETWDRARIETEVLPALLAEYQRYQRYGYWAAETRDGSFVGRMALHPVIIAPPSGLWRHAPTDDSDIVSIGYRLRRQQWGHGYATEAAAAVVNLAFDQYGASRAVATTMAVNQGSRRVLERIGFRHTRTVHLAWDDPLPGTEHGEVVYERDRLAVQ